MGFADHADEDWWDQEKFAELVFDHDVQHGFHCERRQHDDGGVDEDGEVEGVDQAGDVEGWKDREDALEVAWRDLRDLVYLRNHILMGDHDLQTRQYSPTGLGVCLR